MDHIASQALLAMSFAATQDPSQQYTGTADGESPARGGARKRGRGRGSQSNATSTSTTGDDDPTRPRRGRGRGRGRGASRGAAGGRGGGRGGRGRGRGGSSSKAGRKGRKKRGGSDDDDDDDDNDDDDNDENTADDDDGGDDDETVVGDEDGEDDEDDEDNEDNATGREDETGNDNQDEHRRRMMMMMMSNGTGVATMGKRSVIPPIDDFIFQDHHQQQQQYQQQQQQQQQSQPAGQSFSSSLPKGTSDDQDLMNAFWAEQTEGIKNLSLDSFKNSELPLSRIKKIMKTDEEVKMISAESPALFAKACELFIMELTARAWVHTEENKRRTVQKSDVSLAISKCDTYDFLIDIVPRDEIKTSKKSDAGSSFAASSAAYDSGMPPGVMSMVDPSNVSTMTPEQLQYYISIQQQLSASQDPLIAKYQTQSQLLQMQMLAAHQPQPPAAQQASQQQPVPPLGPPAMHVQRHAYPGHADMEAQTADSQSVLQQQQFAAAAAFRAMLGDMGAGAGGAAYQQLLQMSGGGGGGGGNAHQGGQP